MFEGYLEDSYYFADHASEFTEERDQKRYYRASIFCAASGLEAFLNFLGDTFAQGGVFHAYEVALLTDKKFGLRHGHFDLLPQDEYHRIEDKLRYLISKFAPDFDISLNPAWPQFLEFKKFRDSITHPRQDEDEVDIKDYQRMIESGLSSIITIMNYLSKGIFKKPLRKKLRDLTL